MTATQAPTPGPLSGTLTDPMERMVAEAFEAAGIGFKTNTACGLDFAIDGAPVFVEVKQFHTPRITEQMARVDNVVAIQGRQAMSWFSSLVRRLAPTDPVEASGETRPTDEEIRSAIKTTEYKYFGAYEFTEDQHTAVDILVRAAQVLLSTSPLALGGQHSTATDFPPDDVLACDTTPARAEAQDEEAAGEPVACPKCGFFSGDDWKQCGGVCPMPGSPHPSPTPAADADRVTLRINADDLALVERVFLPSNPNKLRTAHPDTVKAAHAFKNATAEALAALKSEGK